MKNMINNSFDSIDRLMEFGMGLAVAQQMIATMNHTMREMEYAGQNSTLNMNPAPLLYFAVINKTQVGPLTYSEIEQLIKNDTLAASDLVWYNGLSAWKFPKEIPSIAKLFLLNNKPL